MTDAAPSRRFTRFAWGVLAYNLLVIAWGAYVRATGSGAGCGSHWPLCNGEVVPRPESVETLVEFGHRLTSGLDGLLVAALLVWAFRAFPRRHPVRPAAVLSFLFLVTEALIGAGLVRFELVADNASVARGWAMAAHLVNTFLLVAFLTATAAWSRRGREERGVPLSFSARDPVTWALAGGVAGMLLLGVSGAVAALGDTLFPAASLRAGLADDFSPTAHAFVRLRVWHPVIALAMALYLTAAAGWVRRRRPLARVHRRATALIWLFAGQVGIGLLNLWLAAPVWMQLVHLLAADGVWIALVLLVLAAQSPEALGARPVPGDGERAAPA